MLVDYHVHLEEGPYNSKWLQRTLKALSSFDQNPYPQSSKQAMEYNISLLMNRIKAGNYSEEWLDLYLQKAKDLRLKEVGIVDHLYRFKETRSYFEKAICIDKNTSLGKLQKHWLDSVMTEEMCSFVACIEQAKVKWAKEGVQLKLGIEADYFVGQEEELEKLLAKYDWDYVIGSVHFVEGWGFDNPQTEELFEQYDLKELYTRFFETVEKMIQSKLFDFVAHLDNLKVFNRRVADESFNRSWYERIAQNLVAANMATEINAGLYYRYPAKECCPAPSFLQLLINHQVPITLSSDSHFPDDLGTCIEENAEKLMELGVNEVATFERRQRIMRKL